MQGSKSFRLHVPVELLQNNCPNSDGPIVLTIKNEYSETRVEDSSRLKKSQMSTAIIAVSSSVCLLLLVIIFANVFYYVYTNFETMNTENLNWHYVCLVITTCCLGIAILLDVVCMCIGHACSHAIGLILIAIGTFTLYGGIYAGMAQREAKGLDITHHFVLGIIVCIFYTFLCLNAIFNYSVLYFLGQWSNGVQNHLVPFFITMEIIIYVYFVFTCVSGTQRINQHNIKNITVPLYKSMVVGMTFIALFLPLIVAFTGRSFRRQQELIPALKQYEKSQVNSTYLDVLRPCQ